jgi:cytochrome c556
MKQLLAASVVMLGVLASLPAAAQFQKPEDAVKYRKAAFTVIGTHFGRIGAMVQGKAPLDAAAAAANAEVVAQMARLPFPAFIEGTQGTEKGAAKASLWSERAKFDEGAKKLADEAARLQAAAKTGNAEQLKTAFGATAAVCKACHDDYRVK